MDHTQTRRYRDCLELYLKHDGLNVKQIEREMRDLGHEDFNRRILYNRTEKGEHKLGWIEKYGWKDDLSAAPPSDVPKGIAFPRVPIKDHRRCASAPSEKGGVAADPISGRPGKAEPFRTSSGQSPKDFRSWLRSVSPDMNWDWRHIRYITERLKTVTDGTCKRLMIFLPPRHGKSELVTVRYTAWRLTQNPTMNVILAGYNQQLANRFSRKIKHSLFDAAARETPAADPAPAETQRPTKNPKPNNPPLNSPTPLLPVSSASPLPYLPANASRPRRINSAAEWDTNAGGSVRAVGVGGGVTGFGADLIVIDDPVKSRAEAESSTRRRRLWEWYRDDIQTRLEPDGAVILIQTRWHEHDLAGKLLEEMQTGGDQWDIIDLPALAELRSADCGLRNEEGELVMNEPETTKLDITERDPHSAIRIPQSSDPLGRPAGTALCPERFDEEKLEGIRRKIGSYAFASLYQQHPVPAEGGLFKRAWFSKFVDRAPEGLTWKRGYDLAVSTRTAACYTASFRCAFDQNGNLYIDGGFRDRIEYPDQRRYIIERILAEPDTEHGVELALHGQAIMQELRREPSIRVHLLRGVKVAADKITRALTWAPLAEEGKVIIVRGHWNEAFLEEAGSFPAGAFDDQIDAVSLAVQMFSSRSGEAYSF